MHTYREANKLENPCKRPATEILFIFLLDLKFQVVRQIPIFKTNTYKR